MKWCINKSYRTYEDAFVTEVKSGFNIYIGVKFKTEPLNKMEFA